MTAHPIDPQLLQARLAHLSAVQAIVTRLAGYSATVKNFCLTIGAGLVAVSFQKATPALLPAAIAFVIIFMCLDAYYLALERGFRALYDELGSRDLIDAMNLGIRHRNVTVFDVARALASVSVFGFYLPVMLVVAYLVYASAHVVR